MSNALCWFAGRVGSFVVRAAGVWALAVLLAALPAYGQLAATFGPRGEITELRVGEKRCFGSVGMVVVKPGWSGELANQARGDAFRQTRSGDRILWVGTLGGNDGARFACRITAEQGPGKLLMGYVLTPDRDVAVESAGLRALMPAAEHAGTTSFMLASDTVARGTWPREVPPASHVVAPGRELEWLSFAWGGDAALRMVARGTTVQLQDDRFFKASDLEVLMGGHKGTLKAGVPVEFSLELEATTSAQVEKEAKTMSMTDLQGMKQTSSPALRSVRAVSDAVPVMGLADLLISVDGTYDNPFDPTQVAVDAEVRTPSGKVVKVPAFFSAPMHVETKRGLERIRVDGAGRFQTRFTLTQPGKHTVTVQLANQGQTLRSEPVVITAKPSDVQSPGFIRAAGRYFRYDNGKPFICVGENICWANSPAPIAEYGAWFSALGKAGGNWARLWMAYNEKGLEWCATPTAKPGKGAYAGLGRYALDNAFRMDQVLLAAQASDIRLMLCLGTYGEFTQGGYFNEGMWASNPYNAANGGPCATAADFWTNSDARRIYKQRLRYLVARYGWSAHLFAWEFWNEVTPTPEQSAWVAEMAAYLKEIDPNRHLVSTTYGEKATWQCPDVDFTMTHMYGEAGRVPDFTTRIAGDTRKLMEHPKPYLLAEFGIDWQTGDDRWDPKGSGINMHNGAWAALMSGSAGTAMLWYWDSYVHPKNVYGMLTPVTKFAAPINWLSEDFRPATDAMVRVVTQTPERWSDVRVPGEVTWGRTPSDRYHPNPDGTVTGGPVAITIGSPQRAKPDELYTQLTWDLDMAKAGKVTLQLGQVCTAAQLAVAVDGAVVVQRDLKAGPPGEGPWKTTKLNPNYGCWISDYDEDIAVDIPAGKHELTISNLAGDWLQIRSITIPGARSSLYPDVNVLALAGRQTLLAWMQNRQSTWRNEFDGKTPENLDGIQLLLPVPADRPGTRWQVEWFDTWTASVVRRDTATAVKGTLTLPAPKFARDIAVRCTLQR